MDTLDKVEIRNIQTQAIIGVYESEQHAPQLLEIDLTLVWDFSKAFCSDDLQDALDYDAITQRVRAFCEASRYQLIEALAGGIISAVMIRYPVEIVGITICKTQALQGALATVSCTRTRAQMKL